MSDTNIIIDEKLKALIPALSPKERQQLESNILADGCREPLVVWPLPEYTEEDTGHVFKYSDGEIFTHWDEEYGRQEHLIWYAPDDGVDLMEDDWPCVLLDGHNRFEICTENKVSFDVVKKEFTTRAEAEDWMDANQLGRRNLTPDAFKLLLGRRYNRTKKQQSGTGANQHVQRGQSGPSAKTADTLAEQHGVSARTVKRAGQFADAVDKLDLAEEVNSGQTNIPQKAVIDAAKSLPDNPTTEEKEEAKKHVHVSQNSGENEWYTPPEYLDAAKMVMGGIDLDPASCEIANANVQADTFFSKEDDGLSKAWSGNVWMNPPYAQPLIQQFSEKVSVEFDAGNIEQAIVLVNNATETKWFQTMAAESTAVCFPKGRVKFLDPSGAPGAPLQGQAILYFGEKIQAFTEQFSQFGKVWA